MITIEKTQVMNFEAAVRGMRNPMNSWANSDSYYDEDGKYIMGEADLKRAHALSASGTDHRKYLRMIFVSVDITAPLYWWKEYDTYKVGTVANSCSTMHKIADKEFILEDFSYDHLGEKSLYMLNDTIKYLNAVREAFLGTKDKDYWWQMIQLLPSSYNQRRTVQLNYEVLRKMYFARKDHKLDEWHTLCDWMLSLTYFREICSGEGGKD